MRSAFLCILLHVWSLRFSWDFLVFTIALMWLHCGNWSSGGWGLTYCTCLFRQNLICSSTDIVPLSLICVHYTLVSTELLATTKSRGMNEPILSKCQLGYAKINLEILLPADISWIDLSIMENHYSVSPPSQKKCQVQLFSH